MVIYAENQSGTELENTDAQMAVFRTLLARHGVKKSELICLVDYPLPNSQNSLPMRLIILITKNNNFSCIMCTYIFTYLHTEMLFDNIGVINLEVIYLVDWTIPCYFLKSI